MMKTRKDLFPVLLAAMVVVAGCSGIPLSTMWHFRNFGPKDLLQTDPTLIRAALQLEDGVNVNTETAELDVQFKYTNESPQKYSLPLTVLKEGPWVGAGTGKADPGKHWYLFALSSEGVRAFRNMQQDLRGHMDDSGHLEEHVKVKLSVNPGKLEFSDVARRRLQKSGEIFLQIRLELSPQGGFYTLYKGKIPFTSTNLSDDDSQTSD